MNDIVGTVTSNLQIVGNVSPATEIKVLIASTGPQGSKGEKGADAVFPDVISASMITESDDRVFLTSSEKAALLTTKENYTYTQLSSSRVWSIVHGLNKYPSVSVVDSAGSLVVGEVSYVDTNSLIITFTAEFSGKAYLN